MKIFIIGGTGFIGAHITRMLAARGHKLAVYHRGKRFFNQPGVTAFTGDRNDTGLLKAACRSFDPDTVIDTIAFTAGHGRSLQVITEHVCRRLVVLSSCDVYRAYDTLQKRYPETDAVPLAETAPLREQLFPLRHLGREPFNELLFNYDKIIVEQMAAQTGAGTTILRLPAVFGPGDPHGKLDAYLKPMLGGEAQITLGAAQAAWVCTRDYVENVARGVCLAVSSKAAINQVFNLGDMHITELQLVQQLKALTRWKGKILIDNNAEEGANYDQHLWLNSAKVKKMLRYRPVVDMETGLRNTIKWYKQLLK